MRSVLAGCVFALALAAGTAARAAPDAGPDPWIDFRIFSNQLILRSLDGQVLPLDTSDGTMSVTLETQGEDRTIQELHPAVNDQVRLQMARGPAYGEITADGLFGDMRATVGYTGPSAAFSGSDFLLGGNAIFMVPAHSMLTIVGWVQVRSGAKWDKNYIAFERGLMAPMDGTFGERYILDGSDASSQYFITAVNPLDEPAQFYFYSTLFGTAFSNLGEVPPVPEPATWAMLVVGAGVLAQLRRHRGKS